MSWGATARAGNQVTIKYASADRWAMYTNQLSDKLTENLPFSTSLHNGEWRMAEARGTAGHNGVRREIT